MGRRERDARREARPVRTWSAARRVVSREVAPRWTRTGFGEWCAAFLRLFLFLCPLFRLCFCVHSLRHGIRKESVSPLVLSKSGFGISRRESNVYCFLCGLIFSKRCWNSHHWSQFQAWSFLVINSLHSEPGCFPFSQIFPLLKLIRYSEHLLSAILQCSVL